MKICECCLKKVGNATIVCPDCHAIFDLKRYFKKTYKIGKIKNE